MRSTPHSDCAALLQRCLYLAVPTALAIAAVACSEPADNPAPGNTSGSGNVAGASTVLPTAGSAGAGTTTGGSAAGGQGPVGGSGAVVGGAAPTAGSAPVAGTSGAPSGGSGGAGPTEGDTPPVRPLMATMGSGANQQINFTAKQLDPMAGTSPTDTHATAQQHGFVNTNKPLKGKLAMTLGGIGTCCGQGGIGGFAVGLGFHEMAIAMQTKTSSAPDEYKNVPEEQRTDEQNRQMGDARMEAWDGVDRVSWLTINEHDSFAYRAKLAINYMQEQDPGGDWAYFLDANGNVRWSDVYLVGYSYGSQTLAVVAKYVRIGRGIATSGPGNEGFPNATWIKKESATPLDRMFGLWGSENLSNYPETATAAGWLGENINVNGGATVGDLMNGHKFILAGQGHSEFCAGDGGQWKALCQYAFGATQ